MLLIDNNSPKSKNGGWNTPSEELFFIFQSFICFFSGFLFWFFARIHFKLKAKKPNEVDWFANAIRINRLIFYTSWYLTQNRLYGCAAGSKFLFNYTMGTILWTLLPKEISVHWGFLSVLYLSMRCLYHKFYLRKINKSFVKYCWQKCFIY